MAKTAKDTLIAEIHKVYEECYKADWDAYGGIPVSEQTRDAAISFAKALPDGILAPEVVPEPGGELSFSWHKPKNTQVILSILADAEGKAAGDLVHVSCIEIAPEELSSLLLRRFPAEEALNG